MDKCSIISSMVHHMTWKVQLTINNRIISTKTKKVKNCQSLEYKTFQAKLVISSLGCFVIMLLFLL